MHIPSLLSLLPLLAALSATTLATPSSPKAVGELNGIFIKCPTDAKQGSIVCTKDKKKYGICIGPGARATALDVGEKTICG